MARADFSALIHSRVPVGQDVSAPGVGRAAQPTRATAGYASYIKGNFGLARAAFEKAVQLQPRSPGPILTRMGFGWRRNK